MDEDAYGPRHAPTKPEWQAFCDDFERAVRTIHNQSRIVAVIKPDSEREMMTACDSGIGPAVPVTPSSVSICTKTASTR